MTPLLGPLLIAIFFAAVAFLRGTHRRRGPAAARAQRRFSIAMLAAAIATSLIDLFLTRPGRS